MTPRLSIRPMRNSMMGALVAGLVACGSSSTDDGASNGPAGGRAAAGTGLPCDVAELLAAECQTCHGSQPAAAVPMPLSTWEDLTAPAKSNPAVTVAELCVARMKDAAAPMPPGGLLAADQVAIVEGWVGAGLPRGSCDGAGGGPGVVCTSGVYWNDPELENEIARPEMFPGRACINCHLTHPEEEGPPFLLAGTVYPTPHEPNDCYGLGAVEVEVIDALGRSFAMSTNAAGNFFLEDDPGAVAMPITAKVHKGGKTREMTDPVDSGDCNGCHTQDGASGAPGRIRAP